MLCVHVIVAEENKAADPLGAHTPLCMHPFGDQRLVSPDVFSGHRASLSHALRSPTLPFLEVYTFWCQVYGLYPFALSPFTV